MSDSGDELRPARAALRFFALGLSTLAASLLVLLVALRQSGSNQLLGWGLGTLSGTGVSAVLAAVAVYAGAIAALCFLSASRFAREDKRRTVGVFLSIAACMIALPLAALAVLSLISTLK